MQTKTMNGSGFIPNAAEEISPYNSWLTWLKNVAIKIVQYYYLLVNLGYKYTAHDYWEIIHLHAFMNLSLDEVADRHNQLLYEIENSHRRYKKETEQFNDTRNRRRKLCPSGDNVRKYRYTLPKYIIDNLNWAIFKA